MVNERGTNRIYKKHTSTDCEEATLGLYDYRARFYDPLPGRFIQPDSLVPGAGNPLAWDRYAYTLNNPVRYTDPGGHFACGDGVDDPRCEKFEPTLKDSKIIFQFDTKVIIEESIPFTPEQLRDWGTNLNHFALGVDALAELIVIGHMGVGTTTGTIFEGNPVSGIPSGFAGGWILGETNPIVQSLITVGNVSATIASTASILADMKSGDSRLQFQIAQAPKNITMTGNIFFSSNSLASGYLTTLGWATRIVEGSLLIQTAAVAFDHGVINTHIYNVPLNFQISTQVVWYKE